MDMRIPKSQRRSVNPLKGKVSLACSLFCLLITCGVIMEEWKDVPGYEGYYQASTIGRIRGVPRVQESYGNRYMKIKGKIISPFLGNKGRYYRLGLHRAGSYRKYFVHVLMGITFYGDIPEGCCVCHNDGNSLNNRVENIRIDTFSNNEKDKIKHGTRHLGLKHPGSKFTYKDVVNIKRLLKNGVRGTVIAALYNVHYVTIYRIRDGDTYEDIRCDA